MFIIGFFQFLAKIYFIYQAVHPIAFNTNPCLSPPIISISMSKTSTHLKAVICNVIFDNRKLSDLERCHNTFT